MENVLKYKDFVGSVQFNAQTKYSTARLSTLLI